MHHEVSVPCWFPFLVDKLGSPWDSDDQKSIRQSPKKPGRGSRLPEQTDGPGIDVQKHVLGERLRIWTALCRGCCWVCSVTLTEFQKKPNIRQLTGLCIALNRAQKELSFAHVGPAKVHGATNMAAWGVHAVCNLIASSVLPHWLPLGISSFVLVTWCIRVSQFSAF